MAGWAFSRITYLLVFLNSNEVGSQLWLEFFFFCIANADDKSSSKWKKAVCLLLLLDQGNLIGVCTCGHYQMKSLQDTLESELGRKTYLLNRLNFILSLLNVCKLPRSGTDRQTDSVEHCDILPCLDASLLYIIANVFHTFWKKNHAKWSNSNQSWRISLMS